MEEQIFRLKAICSIWISLPANCFGTISISSWGPKKNQSQSSRASNHGTYRFRVRCGSRNAGFTVLRQSVSGKAAIRSRVILPLSIPLCSGE